MAAASISASLLLCLLLSDFAFSEDQINIPAVIGENKILPCRAENGSILLLQWKRTDIKEQNVLLFRNGVVDTENQHQPFKNRVVFQDIEKKDGDVSLVLIDVTMNDAGTYEAEVVYHGTKREKKLICSIHLDVAPPPSPPPPPPPDQINITTVIGENKTLPCRAENGSIRFVEWRRTDIKEENVLRYRNDAVDPGDQHPSFKNRVIFQDIEMKDGNVSLVLINVRMNDSGTYEAEVVYEEPDREGKLICSIHLHIAPPSGSSQYRAKTPLVISVLGMIVILVFFFVVIVAVQSSKCSGDRRKAPPPVKSHRWSQERSTSYSLRSYVEAEMETTETSTCK